MFLGRDSELGCVALAPFSVCAYADCEAYLERSFIMSVTSRSPLRMAGANINSGNLNTGEVNWTRGGAVRASVYSGALTMSGGGYSALSSGGQILLFSGAGRLNSFTALFPAGVALAGNGVIGILSGLPIVAYDSVVLARSGLFLDGLIAESGRPILYTWHTSQMLSGGLLMLNNDAPGYVPIQVDVPFNSGLCVMAISGSPGFVITYTPETNLPNPG